MIDWRTWLYFHRRADYRDFIESRLSWFASGTAFNQGTPSGGYWLVPPKKSM